jgi:hypothetical protein
VVERPEPSRRGARSGSEEIAAERRSGAEAEVAAALQRTAGNHALAAYIGRMRLRADTARVQRTIRITNRPNLGTVEGDFDARAGNPNFGDPRAINYAEFRRSLFARLDVPSRELYVAWVRDQKLNEFASVPALEAALERAQRTPERLAAWLQQRRVLVDRGKRLDVTSMAAFRLRAICAAGQANDYDTLDVLHAALVTWVGVQLDQMVAANVPEADLDIAVAMYARLDATGITDEAILHKLTWHQFHERQYAQRGLSEEEEADKGLVYSPFRSGATQAPTTGFGAGFVGVHTMPLNVAWLLACCHHKVKFRLYAPLTQRALYRGEAHKVVGAAGEQQQLSALGREMMALVATGYYTVREEALDLGPGRLHGTRFETTYVLEPTASAQNATMASLTVVDNLTWDQVQRALSDRGVRVETDANVDGLGAEYTSDGSTFNTQRNIRDTNLELARTATTKPEYDKFMGRARTKQQAMDLLIAKWGWDAQPLVVPPEPVVQPVLII